MEQLQTLLTGALEARGRVLLKLNVDEANLDAVIGLLPALKSPTVSKLFNDDAYAVETVVAKESSRRNSSPSPILAKARSPRTISAARDVPSRTLAISF